MFEINALILLYTALGWPMFLSKYIVRWPCFRLANCSGYKQFFGTEPCWNLMRNCTWKQMQVVGGLDEIMVFHAMLMKINITHNKSSYIAPLLKFDLAFLVINLSLWY